MMNNFNQANQNNLGAQSLNNNVSNVDILIMMVNKLLILNITMEHNSMVIMQVLWWMLRKKNIQL